MDTHTLQQIDRLQAQPESGVAGTAISPMDPPNAFAPPASADQIPLEALHPVLRQLREEHTALLEEITRFEAAILAIQQEGYTKTHDLALRHFFHCFEHDFIPHSRREDAQLFPLLHARLVESGEHAIATDPTTAVDLMEDDHVKAVQLAAVVVNFLGLAFQLPDDASRLIVLDAALEQGKNLVELLRLHIFREDHILFPMAHRLITADEFDRMHGGSPS